MVCFSQNFKCKASLESVIHDYLKIASKKTPFFQGGAKTSQTKSRMDILKFQSISFLPLYSRTHFKTVFMNSLARSSGPDSYQRILSIQISFLIYKEAISWLYCPFKSKYFFIFHRRQSLPKLITQRHTSSFPLLIQQKEGIKVQLITV